MFAKQSHVDPSRSSSTSPPLQKELSAEELRLFADAMEKIFSEPFSSVVQPVKPSAVATKAAA
jgi:hypothetical protein